MVSTLAAGDVGHYVNVADMSMTPSVTDLAGLNNTSRTVLHKAAFGIVGMTSAGPAAGTGKPPIALTMFGVTTPCVTAVTEQLQDRFRLHRISWNRKVDARWKNSPTALSSMA